MAPSPSWQVGPWILEPTGLAAFGNPVEALSPELKAHWPGETSAPDLPPALAGDFARRLDSGVDAARLITAEEVGQFLQLKASGKDLWETFLEEKHVQIQIYRDRSLCGGVFVRLSAQLPRVASTAHVAACFLDFRDRAGWDRQVDNFKVLNNDSGNDLLYYCMHPGILADRDFLVFHALMRHVSGRGLLFYSRSASDTFFGKTRAVRARQYVLSTEVSECPSGGTQWTTICAVDPRIPIPKWIMNMCLPGEFRKWVKSVERRSLERMASGVAPAGAWLFQCPEPRLELGPKADEVPGGSDDEAAESSTSPAAAPSTSTTTASPSPATTASEHAPASEAKGAASEQAPASEALPLDVSQDLFSDLGVKSKMVVGGACPGKEVGLIDSKEVNPRSTSCCRLPLGFLSYCS